MLPVAWLYMLAHPAGWLTVASLVAIQFVYWDVRKRLAKRHAGVKTDAELQAALARGDAHELSKPAVRVTIGVAVAITLGLYFGFSALL